MKTAAQRHEQFGRSPVAAITEAIADIAILETKLAAVRDARNVNDERIAELRRLCEEATPGSWAGRIGVGGCDYIVKAERSSDAAFIAAARTAVPELLAECERLRACLAKANSNHETFERLWYLACDERDHIWPLWKLRYEIRYKLGFLVRDYPGDKQAASLLAAIDSALSAEGEKEKTNEH